MNQLLSMLASVPGGPTIIEWGGSLGTMSRAELAVEFGRLFLQMVGLWEFLKHLYRWIFKRRSRLEKEVEALETRAKERNDTIAKLRDEEEANHRRARSHAWPIAGSGHGSRR